MTSPTASTPTGHPPGSARPGAEGATPAPLLAPTSPPPSPAPEVLATLSTITAALSTLRISIAGQSEAALVDRMSAALTAAGLPHTREVRLAPRCRIDLLVPVPRTPHSIGIEAKKSRPRAPEAFAQVERYAGTERIAALIFVAERAIDLPDTIAGIPVRSVSLNALMGIAL